MRALVVLYARERGPTSAGVARLTYERGRSFWWTGEFADAVAKLRAPSIPAPSPPPPATSWPPGPPHIRHEADMTFRHFLPLVGFVLPSLVIGYGFVLPRNHISVGHDLSIGFLSTVAGACITYALGVRAALAKPKA